MSMAPNAETSGLRNALAIGAARAVLVSDPVLAGSDALATAKVLAAAIRRLGAGPRARRQPSRPTATPARRRSRWQSCSAGHRSASPSTSRSSDGSLRVQRQTEAGYDEVTCPLPAVVTVTAGVVEPRYPSFKGIMAAKSKPVEEVTVADLGLDPSEVGCCGARQQVVSVEAAEARKAGEIVVDDGDAHERVISFLEQLKVL